MTKLDIYLGFTVFVLMPCALGLLSIGLVALFRFLDKFDKGVRVTSEMVIDEPALDGTGEPIKDADGRFVSKRTTSTTTPTIEDDDDIEIPEIPDPQRRPQDRRAR